MEIKQSQQIVVDALFACRTRHTTEAAIPSEGRVVFSELAHPVYEAVFEVRLMQTGEFRVFHHHGDPCIAWQDEVAPAYMSRDAAIGKVREYQGLFCSISARRRQELCA